MIWSDINFRTLIAGKSALKWHNYQMFWSPIIVLSKQIIGDQTFDNCVISTKADVWAISTSIARNNSIENIKINMKERSYISKHLYCVIKRYDNYL